MKILEQLNKDYKEALKEKQTEKKNTLRLLLNSIEQKEIEKGKESELKKEDVIVVLKKEAQQREESIEQYEKASRDELAKKEKRELELIEKYLPEQLSEEEIAAEVDQVIEEMNAEGLDDLGKVMGKTMPKLKGKADGEKVKDIAQEKLS